MNIIGKGIYCKRELPVKGALINLDLDNKGEKQYRVLSIDGNVAKLLGMSDISTSQYNATSKTTSMNTITVQQYAESTLDNYLNITWYNTLKDTIKDAIIPQTITQDAWYGSASGIPSYSGTYGTTVPGTNNYNISKFTRGPLRVGDRNIYALSVQDVISYLSDENMRVDTSAILRNVNIWKMFWNTEIQSDDYSNLWLRSASATNTERVWAIGGSAGYLGFATPVNDAAVRPAFNIDLSKIPYSIV